MTAVSPLPVAVRAFTKRERTASRRKRGGRRKPPQYALVFDTETTTDSSQRLNFGAYRYVRIDWVAGEPRLTRLKEGLFYANDLPERDPEGFKNLQRYVQSHPAADVQQLDEEAAWRLGLESVEAFIDKVLWPAAFRARALLVCFNFPFDISRIATHAGEARHPRRRDDKDPGLSPYAGGFSFRLKGHISPEKGARDDLFRSRVLVKALDSKRSLKGFQAPQKIHEADVLPDDPDDLETQVKTFGHLLDLRTLAFALTDRGFTLEKACNAFGVPYTKRKVEHGIITPEHVDYCREDVQATENLLRALLAEFFRHPIDLQEHQAFSPATIGKSYLRSMGIKSPLQRQPDFPPEILGFAMSAYYGGRAEARIRKVPVPVVYCDFLSMYPTVNALMGTQELLTARRIDTKDATEDLRELLRTITVEGCFDPSLWPSLLGVAQIMPQGDILPVRAFYRKKGEWQIGINPLTSTQPLWYTFADLVAATLLTGTPPNILKAIRFTGNGRVRTVPTKLLGEVPLDPMKDVIFSEVIKRRKIIERDDPEDWRARALKILANATGYGIYAEMRRVDLRAGEREPVTIYGVEQFTRTLDSPEEPGEYCFPPLAACITGAARLMLAMLEVLVVHRGGSYAFCDTDSMAIVASKEGGLLACPGGAHQLPDGTAAVSALTWRQVDEIRRRFDALDPYKINEQILKLEDENYALKADGKKVDRSRRQQVYCYAISAKRYVLFNLDERGDVIIRKPSEHGLGHLMNPMDPEEENRPWISQGWKRLLTQDLRLRTAKPEWIDRPGVGQQTISQSAVWRLFTPQSRNYGAEVKPFNFVNVAFVSGLEIPPDEDAMVLVAPYERDPRKWLDRAWTNRASKKQYSITIDDLAGFVMPNVVRVKTFADVFDEYAAHEEAKFAGPDGEPCASNTRGLLQRRPVVAEGSVHHIGKETNDLDERIAGLAVDPDASIQDWGFDLENQFREAVSYLNQVEGKVRKVARRTGFSQSTVSEVLRGKANPRPQNKMRYIKCAEEELAKHELGSAD